MKTKEIHVAVKFTKNLGNYQSFVAEAGIVAELDQGETTIDAFNAAWEVAKDQVKTQLKNLNNGGMPT